MTGVKVQLDMDYIRKSRQDFEKYLKDMEELANKNVIKIKVENVNSQLNETRRSFQNINNETRSFVDNMEYAIKRVAQFAMGISIIYGSLRELKSGLQEIEEINKRNINVAMITGDSLENVKRSNAQTMELAKNLRVLHEEVQNGQEAWLRSGVSQEEANKNLETTTKLSKIAGVSNGEMADSLIVVKNAYDLNSKSLEGYASKVSLLDNASATSSKKINTAMQYAAETFKEMKVPIDTALSWVTNFSEKSAMQGEAIGRGFRSMLINFHTMKKGFSDGDKEQTKSVNKLEELLNSKGIALRKNKDQWIEIDKVIENIQKSIGKFTDVEKSQLAFRIGGKEQSQIVLSTLNNMQRIKELQGDLEKDSGAKALNSSFEKYKQGIEAAKANLKNATTSFWMNVIDEKKVESAIGGLTNLTKTLEILATTEKSSGVALVALSTSFILLIKNTEMVRNSFIKLGAIMELFTVIQKGVGTTAALSGAFSALASSVKASTLAFVTNPITLTIAALSALTYGVIKHVQHQKELKDQVSSLTTSYKGLTEAMKENNQEGMKSNSKDLKKDQDKLQNLIEQKKKAEKDFDEASKNMGKNTSDFSLDKAGNKLRKISEAIEEQKKVMKEAGVSFDEVTGKIYAVAEAELQIKNNDNVENIKKLAETEFEHKDRIVELADAYNNLNEQQGKDSTQKADMTRIAEELHSKISDLILVKDSEGNVTIQNTDLLNKEVNMLKVEGVNVNSLSKLKLTAAKDNAQAQINETAMTYKQMKERLKMYATESQAIADKRNQLRANDKMAEAIGLQKPRTYNFNTGKWEGGNPVSNLLDEADKDFEDTHQKMLDAVAQLDKIYGDSTDSVNNLKNAEEGFTPAVEDNTKKIKKNTEAQNALQQAIKKVRNEMKSCENQIKSVDNALYSLDLSMDGMDKTSGDYINSLKNENEMFRQRISLVNSATQANNGFINSLGGMAGVGGSALQQQVVQTAEQYLGIPYLWGGKDPSAGGIDCSGLVELAYKQIGIDLSGSTYNQIKQGTEVSKEELQPGDLVFFGSSSDPHHVGIYAGNGNFVESPSSGKNVRIASLDNRSDYLTARRVISGGSDSSSNGSITMSAESIDAVLEGVLKGYGADYVRAGEKYGVDPALAASIGMLETGRGTSDALKSQNNPGGIMDWDNNWETTRSFNSLAEGIDFTVKNLRDLYISKGLTTIDQIGATYAPKGAANDPNGTNKDWIPNVKSFYSQMGGLEKIADTATGEIENILSKNQDYVKQNLDFTRKIVENNTKIYDAYIGRFDKDVNESTKNIDLLKEKYEAFEKEDNNMAHHIKEEEWKEINNQYSILTKKEAFINSQMNLNIYDKETLAKIKLDLKDIHLEEFKTMNNLRNAFKEWLDDRLISKTQTFKDNIEQMNSELNLLNEKDSNGYISEKISLNEKILDQHRKKIEALKFEISFVQDLRNKEEYSATKVLWENKLKEYHNKLIEANTEMQKAIKAVEEANISKILDDTDKRLKLINQDLKDIDSKEKEMSDSNVSSKLINTMNKASDYITILKEDVNAYNDIYKEVTKDGIITSEEQKKLDEQSNKIATNKDNIIQIKQQLEGLRLDNIIAPFANAISKITNNMSKLTYQLNMLVTTDYTGKANILSEQLGFNRTKVNNLFEEYNKLINENAKAGTKEADELSKRLTGVRDSLVQASVEGLNLKKQLQDISLSVIFEEIDKPQRNVNQQMSNIDFTTSMGSENKGLLLGNNFLDSTDQYKDNTEKQLEETEKVSNALDNINNKLSDLTSNTYDIDTSDMIKTIENTTNTTNDILNNIKDSVNQINANNSQSIEVKNVYGTGKDLFNAKELATIYGISNLFRFIDTNTSEYLKNKDKYKITSNDIVLGGTGATGGISDSNINGAKRLGGADSTDTKNRIEDYMKSIVEVLKTNNNVNNVNDTTANNKELITALNVNNTNSSNIVTNTANDVMATQTQTQELTSADATNSKTIVDTIKEYTNKIEDIINNADNDLKIINTSIIKLDTDLTSILSKLGTIDINNISELNEVLKELSNLHGSLNSLGDLVANVNSGEERRFRFNGTNPIEIKDKKEVDKKATGGGTTDPWNIVGEEGEEGAILPNGQITSVGEKGWTLQRFPIGTTIINHKDFERVKRQGGVVETSHYAKGTKNYKVFAKSDPNEYEGLKGDYENASEYITGLGRDDIQIILYNGSQKINSDDIVLGGTAVISDTEANGATRKFGEGRRGTFDAFKAWERNTPVQVNSNDIQKTPNQNTKPIPPTSNTSNNHSSSSANLNPTSTGVNVEEYTKLDNTAYRQGLNTSITNIQSRYTDQLQNGASNSELLQDEIELQQKNILLNNDAIKQLKEKEKLYAGNSEALKKIADEESNLNKIIQDEQKKIQDLSKQKVNALFEDSDKKLKIIEDDIKKIGNIDTPDEKLRQLKDINKELDIHKKDLDLINIKEEENYKQILNKTNNPRLNELINKQINGVLTDSEKTEIVKIKSELPKDVKLFLQDIVGQLQALRDKKVNVEVDVKVKENIIENEMRDRARAVIEKRKSFDEEQFTENKKKWEKEYFRVSEQEWNNYHNNKINKLQEELNEAKKLAELNENNLYYKDEVLAKEIEIDNTRKESYSNIKHFQEEFNKVHQARIQELENSKKLEEEKETRLKNENSLLLLQKQLSESLNQKNVQQLVKTKSGWQFQYTADMARVDEIQKQINEKHKDNNKWESNNKLEKEKQSEEDLIKIKKESYDKIVRDHQEILEQTYGNIEFLTDKFLQELKLKYGNDPTTITTLLTETLNKYTDGLKDYTGSVNERVQEIIDLIKDLKIDTSPKNQDTSSIINGMENAYDLSKEELIKLNDLIINPNKSQELSDFVKNMLTKGKEEEIKDVLKKYLPLGTDVDEWLKQTNQPKLPTGSNSNGKTSIPETSIDKENPKAVYMRSPDGKYIYTLKDDDNIRYKLSQGYAFADIRNNSGGISNNNSANDLYKKKDDLGNIYRLGDVLMLDNKTGKKLYVAPQNVEDLKAIGWTITQFKTGGETGSWGNEGRVAILHEKERVLDKTQTETFDNLVYKQLPELKNVIPNLINAVQLPTLNFKLPDLSGISNKQGGQSITHNHFDKIVLPNVSNGQEFVNQLNHIDTYMIQENGI